MIDWGRFLERLVVVAFVGVVVGWTAFAMTSSTIPYQTSTGGLCRSFDQRNGGFDPWTGSPFGVSFTCDNSLRQEPVPVGIVGRRAVPVPVGFVLGAISAATALLVLDRRHRPGPTS